MINRQSFSFRTKLVLMLLLLSLFSGVVIIYSVYSNGRKGMTENIFKHLTSVRSAKKYEIESYFKHTANVVEILGKNPTVVEATKSFKNGFAKINDKAATVDCRDSLSLFYEEYLHKVAANLDVNFDTDMYYPTSAAACYLQYEYIVRNPHPLGEKNNLVTAQDETNYSEVHRKHHKYFNNLIKEMGFYDIFLVDLDSGDIIYSAYKEADFATNLYSGPYSQSNFATLVKKLNANRDLKSATMVDFKNYRPSYGAPASFMGIPLRDGSETVGALVVQIPVNQINEVMTSNYNWESSGLGASGETYLVGEDFLMRSISRFYLEDTSNFKIELMDVGIKESNIDRMYNVGTTILNLRIRTEASKEALVGKTDTKVVQDYRGVSVLSSYTPLQIPGLKWAILSEIDHSEAHQELHAFKRNIFITLALLLLVLTFLATWIADSLVSPLDKLKVGIANLKKGQFKQIGIAGNDEFTSLITQFNDMVTEIKSTQDKIHQINQENEKLLFNFVPKAIAKRLKAGEKEIIEIHPNVSLILVDVVDFTDLVDIMGEKDAILKLNELIDAFDSAAKRHHIEKIRTLGDNYYGSCGLFSPRMDHTKRIVDYAKDLLKTTQQFNSSNELNLGLVIGINSGPVTSGIVGKENFNFDLLGATVNDLFSLLELQKVNEIIVANSTYLKTKDFFEFDQLDTDLDFPVYQLTAEAAVNV